jgi:transposase
MNNVPHLQLPSALQSTGTKNSPLQKNVVVLTQKEHIELKWHANFWEVQHSRAIKRELSLKNELQQARAEIIDLKQRLYGKKSEKSARKDGGPNKRQGSSRNKGQQPGSKGHGRTQRPDLPVVEEIYDLSPEEKCCSVCGFARPEFFKTEDSEIIEVQVSGYIRKIKRKQYKPCECERNKVPGIITAPSAARLIPKSSVGISVWVEVVLGKFLFSCPTNRLCTDFDYLGLPISQGTITGGLQRLIELFKPLAEAMLTKQMSERLFHGDETRWMVFETTEGKTGYYWFLWIIQSASVVYYRVSPGRGADVPKEHFSSMPKDVSQVIFVCDRYSAYKKLAKDCSYILLAFCWVHVRRDFLEAARSRPENEEWMFSWVEDIRELYKLNAARLEYWQEFIPLPEQSTIFSRHHRKLTQKISEIKKRYDNCLQDQELATPKRKVLESLKNHWPGLTLFVEHPQVAMDNNKAERGIRNPVTGRKNYYGSGSIWSATLAALMFSTLQTLLLWGINPRHWMHSFLSACAENRGTSPSDISPFLPWEMDEERRQKLSRPMFSGRHTVNNPPSFIPEHAISNSS